MNISIYTNDMTANELAFAIAAVVGHAYIGDMRDALEALIGKDEAVAAIQIALKIVGANQF
jgi:hypothetical protein